MSSPARRDRFEDVAAEVLEPLRRYLARRTDHATAEDVLADTLLVCWRRLDEVPDPALPWAYAAARRCLANATRSARRQRRVAGKVATIDPPATGVPGPGEDGPGAAAVAEALAALPPQDAELLRLWAWEQLTPAEIAVVLDLTANAVSIRLHRARQKVRAQLERTGRKTGADAGHERSTDGRTP